MDIKKILKIIFTIWKSEIKKVLFYGIFLSLLLLLFIFSTTFAQTPEITNGLNYLTSIQNLDGSWDSDTTEALPATVAVIEAMQVLGKTSSQNYTDAVSWLQSQDLETTDYLSERIHALSDAGTDIDVVISYLDAIYTGAWGGYRDFEANNLDTTLALHALNAINYSDLDTISYALGYLIGNQNPDGGWGFTGGDDASASSAQSSNVYMTALVLRVLNVLSSTFNVQSSIDNATTYLLSKQNPDGAISTDASTIFETALAFEALIASGADPSTSSGQAFQPAIDYLLTNQLPNGSWNDDSYSTALAIRALANVKPNLTISSNDITFSNPVPTIGDIIDISATVKNDGLSDASNITVSFFDGDPEAGGILIDETIITNIPQSGSETTSINWTASTADIHNISVIIDPQDTIAEANESDNLAIAQVRVYEKTDLTIDEITFIPELPSLGQVVDAQVKVTNIGGLQANNAAVKLYVDGVASSETALATLNSQQSEVVTFTLQNLSNGIHQITATVDPDNTIIEGDETNNTLTQVIEVKERIDLIANSSGIYFSDSNPKEGEIIYITAVIFNARESTADNVLVRLYDGDPYTGGIQIGGDQIISSIPGGSTGSTEWIQYDTTGKSGRNTIYVIVDPLDIIEETNEVNNIAINTFKVDARADLIVQDIQFIPSTPEEGDIVQIKAVVKNIGSVKSKGTKLKFYLGDPSSGGEQIGIDLNIGTIAPDATRTTNYINFNTAEKLGDNEIYAVIDLFNTVDEINENNNTSQKTLTVSESVRPDLTLKSSDITFIPAKPAIEDLITISALIQNLKNTPASSVDVGFFDGDPDSGGILIGSVSLPEISGLATGVAEITWDAAGIKGIHEIYVKIDPDNTISESNEENNEASTVLKISLPEGAAPRNLTATPINNTDIELNWEPGPEAAAYGIVGYNIYKNNIWVNSLRDISREGTASASSEYYSNTAEKAVDGNINTYWWADYMAELPQWWQEDFASQRKIKKIAIYWYSTYYAAKDFEIQTWDGIHWVTQSIITGNDKDITVIDFPATVSTDKVRIYITADNNIYYHPLIREVDIYEYRFVKATTYQDTNLGAGNYTYYVTAVDADEVESLPSNEAKASLEDVTPPALPLGLTATVNGFNIDLTWNANSEPDLSGYRVYREGLNVAHSRRGTVIVGSNGSYHDRVIDGYTTNNGYTHWDTTPPGTMTIILPKVYEINKIKMLLYGTDERFYRYKIESSIDGENWQTVVDKTSGEWRGWQEEIFAQPIQARYLRITGTFSSVDRYFRVSEFEAYTPELAIKTLDTVGWISVYALNYSNFYEYTYDWDAYSRQPRRFVFSEFNTEEKDVLYIYDKDTGLLLASYSGDLGAFVTPLLTATNYRFQFIADFEVTASGFKIAKYIIHGKQTATTYTETIYRNGDYRYAVTAIDTSGNESDLSDIVTATIADTIPPAIPRNLTAKAGNGIVELTWTRNTEPDLAGYNLYRNGETAPLNGDILINTDSYDDLDVTNLTTYTYRMTAVDINGNESEKSVPVTATPTGIDLTINQTETAVDIFIFPQKPTIFDTATITALVKNIGTETVNNVKVSFYDGDPDAGGALIGSTVITEDIPENGTEIAQITWDLIDAEGTHTIYAVVDLDNAIPELDETNNTAYKEFIVTTDPGITVDINTISVENFPTIETEVRVRDANDNAIFGLNENNFAVTEDGAVALPITVTSLTDPQSTIPKVDVVFVIDTSGSMGPEWQTVCGVIDDIVELLAAQGIDLDYTIYSLAYQRYCGTVLSQVIYDGELKSAHSEDWGPGTTWAAIMYPWREGAARIVIPISDENAYAGTPETQEDLNSIQEAIEACVANEVIAYPFYSENRSGVKEEADNLAEGTEGIAFYFQDANQVINEIVKAAKRSVSDYLITYTTPNLARDGTLRDIKIDTFYGIASGTDTGQYRAPLDEKADLAIKSLILSNDNPLPGENITITTEIQNLGGLEAKDVLVRFYNGEPSYGIQLGEDQIISNLLPAGITTLTAQLLAIVGTHDLYVVIDPLNDIYESNEDNNIAFRTVTVPGSELPELGIHKNDITFSKANTARGETITINATIHNTGADASDILVLTYLGNPLNGGIQIGSATIPSLLSNSTATIQTRWPIDKPAGTYDIYIRVDPYNTIHEGNENDNIAYNTITVIEKEVSVEVTTDRVQYQANTDVGITVLVKNNEAAPWSGRGEVHIEDSSGNQVAHVATFTIDDLKPTGIAGWTYRVAANVTAAWDMEDTLAEVDVDFGLILESLGIPDKTVDKNSIRILEFDDIGNLIGEKQARAVFQTDTSAEVIWLMDGLTMIDTTRYFSIYFDITDNGNKEPSTNTGLPETGRLIAFSDDRGNIYTVENNGDGTFEIPVLIDDVSTAYDYTRGIVLDDFNNDNFIDIVTGSGSNGEIYYYQNIADGSDTFNPKSLIGTITASRYIMDMAEADFNNDGNKDFVVSGNANNLLYLFKGSGDGTFVQSFIPAPSGYNYFRGKTAVDVDEDGNVDLIVGNNYGVIYLYMGKGDGTFLSPIWIVDIGFDPYGVVAGDFDGNGKVDIIANNGNTGDAYILKGNGDGTFESPSLIPSLDTNNYTAFDAGDFNNDGHLDVIAATYTSRTIDFYPGNGEGAFGLKTTITITANYTYTLGISSSLPLPEVHPVLGTPETVPSLSFNFIWNTGATLSGNYKVHVTLSEGEGVIAEDYASFKILPDIRVDSKVVTDKISYNANESVTITSTITNLSENFVFENLNAKVTIADSQGTEFYTETNVIPILTPGQLTELKTYWNTGQNPPGTYNTILEVTYNATVLSTSSAAFEITGTPVAGKNIIGSLTVSPASVESGESVTLDHSVTNTGNSDIPDMTVQVLVVNPGTEEVLYTFQHQDSLPINTTATYIDEYGTEGLNPGIYMAVLHALIDGETLSIDSAVFEVIPKAGPELEAAKTIPDIKNVLVWLNYPWQSEQNSPDRGLIEQALNEAKVSYYIVLDKKDFQTELRNPYYTDFLIFAEHNPIEDHFAEELREQVYSGKGLISSLFNRQNLNEKVFGIKFTGHLSNRDYPIQLIDSEIAIQSDFQSYGRAQKVEAENILGWILEATNKYPGIIKNEYGEGNVLFFAFDLGLSSTNYGPFATLLNNSLNYIHTPLYTTAYHPDQLVPVEIKIKSLGGSFDLRITETYPEEFKLYDASASLLSTGQWITDNPWTIEIHLDPYETKTILYYALTPDKAGTYTLQTEVGYLEGETYNFYQNLNLDITIDKSANDMADDVISALNALSVSAEDREKLDNAIRYIENVQNRAVTSEKDIDKNIHDILKAIDSLLFITSTDTSAVRLMMDDLLRIWEGKYYLGLT